MAKENYNTPFDKAACPVPGANDATMAGQKGGYDWTDMPGETPNMSEMSTVLNSTLDVKDGPAPWSGVAVEPGVASPAVPAASIPNVK